MSRDRIKSQPVLSAFQVAYDQVGHGCFVQAFVNGSVELDQSVGDKFDAFAHEPASVRRGKALLDPIGNLGRDVAAQHLIKPLTTEKLWIMALFRDVQNTNIPSKS